MTEHDFIPKSYSNSIENGKVSWESPSNIALIKYWGKSEPQIPKNPSISFTLSNCKTITSLEFSKKENDGNFSLEVYLDGELKESFKPKIETFFKRIEPYMPFLRDYHFKVETKNTFPHSSGIASSASGMSALALCLMSIEKLLVTSSAVETSFFNQKASFLARLGSGSACRSIEGDLIVWGQTKSIEG
ncbi:MAG TPA: hypothetical protein VKZ97_00140, partial [Flavobacteriaceae bacterium]|nr:hypothetical protein [Flavobacteriaceae bacterium]